MSTFRPIAPIIIMTEPQLSTMSLSHRINNLTPARELLEYRSIRNLTETIGWLHQNYASREYQLNLLYYEFAISKVQFKL